MCYEIELQIERPNETCASMLTLSVIPVRQLAEILMTSYQAVSLSILVLTSGVLFWVALTDLNKFKIKNEFVILLAALYLIYALVSGRWAALPQHVAFAALMLAGMIYAYTLKQMGGGDLKLLAVAFLWTGPWSAAPFAVLLMACSLAYYLAARVGWAASRKSEAGLRIPLAPSVAGALIGIFALGFVTPA